MESTNQPPAHKETDPATPAASIQAALPADPPTNRHRWRVIAVFFAFMLLHQSDKLLIGPLTTPIMETFGLNNAQMGGIVTGALLVGTILYPLWGYLYDRYARAPLLALASLIWGATTWLSAIAPTYGAFLVTRATTGIDDSSYPGLYSLTSDLFGPKMRGKVFGILQISQPLGYLIGMGLALGLGPILGWRAIFYITGGLGLVVAVAIYFTVKEPQRGQSEPELAGLEEMGVYRFNRQAALGLFKKPSLLFLFAQGFFGNFPWNIIAFWFFAYLETERLYDENAILFTMAPAVLVLGAGYFVGGSLGDALFKRTPRGRLLISMTGITLGVIWMALTMSVPIDNRITFFVLLLITALFIPFSSANVIATVHDITVPEVRSTALSVQYFIENGSAALAPLLAGLVADRTSLHTAILSLSVVAWVISGIFVALAAWLVPKDIAALREQMRLRAV